MLKIARPSVASLKLEMLWSGRILASGTGFLVILNRVTYLVTNWHNFSGRHWDGSVRHSRGVTPDAVKIFHNAQQLGEWTERIEALLDPDGRPLWLEHPHFGSRVDVVALRLTDVEGVEVYAYSPFSGTNSLPVEVSTDVSIIGFPFGHTGGGNFGIWVRGTVATEPGIDHLGYPRFLVGARTRPGQSGSPVIAYSPGGSVPMADGSLVLGSGPIEDFLGVYSGRINEQSDLGFVWKARALGEVLLLGVTPREIRAPGDPMSPLM